MKKSKIVSMFLCSIVVINFFACSSEFSNKGKAEKEEIILDKEKDENNEENKQDGDQEEKNEEDKVTQEDKGKEENTNEEIIKTGDKYKKYYDGTNKLAVNYEGEGIGDAFLEYEFEVLKSGAMQVEISSLRGSFKGALDAMPIEGQWAGEIKNNVEEEKISIGLVITKDAIKLMETDNKQTQEIIFYLASQTFDKREDGKNIEGGKGNFNLEQK
ncbi:MAG: hypothetical protein ACRCWG_00040 [Sarcina sp.]